MTAKLEALNNQFSGNSAFISKEEVEIGDGKKLPEIVDNHASKGIKLDYYNKQGWGYADSGFIATPDKKNVLISGNRYMYAGEVLPNFAPWIAENLGADVAHEDPAQADMTIHAPNINQAFLEELPVEQFSRRSFLKWERIMHSHGATFQEVDQLRFGVIPRCVDCVVYPISTEQTEFLVKLAVKHNVMLVAYGGGTNVTWALKIPETETRMVVSVDTARMNTIKWVDKENQMACVGAGYSGQDLERDLKQYGLCSGHEPDSAEFSTVGGWISTRASGMKKNTYGNIEDIVCNITMVTPAGTYSKSALWPRISNGPDLNHVIMGSEGNIGIITDAVIKVKPLPEAKIFESILFPDFEIGIKFMAAVAKTAKYPTSIRLLDNTQFKFGQTLKPASNSMLHDFLEKVKKFYVINVKGFNEDKMAACTLLFEGEKKEQEDLHYKIVEMAKEYQGMAAGAENGMKGYLLTFLIAYTRDFASGHYVAGESFETSCPWSNVSQLCTRVNKRIIDEALALGFKERGIWISFRVTQLYETGAAIYVYLTLAYKDMNREKIVDYYEHVEDAARDEVMLCGGCISHHHGVGKLRKGFVGRTLPPMAVKIQQDIKLTFDPTNIFGINNTIWRTEEENEQVRKKF